MKRRREILPYSFKGTSFLSAVAFAVQRPSAAHCEPALRRDFMPIAL
ncbi:MAG: hypothetical protein LIO90_04040 [Bacteroidales bacterium]|nr:hypothetical protein [Bacteroidales bacterium]